MLTTHVRGQRLSSGRPSSRRLLAVATAGPVLFASGYVLTDVLPDAPLWNAVTRVLPAGLVLVAIHPSWPTRQWLWRSVVLGAFNFGGFFAAQAFALHRIPGGVAATIAATQTVLVPLGASAVLGERVRWSQLCAAVVGVAGIALLVLRSTVQLDTLGVAAASLLALGAAAGMLFTRRWGLPQGVAHTTATSWQMLAGGVLLLPAALIVEGAPPSMTPTGWVVAAWLALAATAFAFSIIFGALHRGLPATSLSHLMLLCPLAATIAAWLIYRQALSPLQLVGASLVLASVIAAAMQGEPRNRTDRPPISSTEPL